MTLRDRPKLNRSTAFMDVALTFGLLCGPLQRRDLPQPADQWVPLAMSWSTKFSNPRKRTQNRKLSGSIA